MEESSSSYVWSPDEVMARQGYQISPFWLKIPDYISNHQNPYHIHIHTHDYSLSPRAVFKFDLSRLAPFIVLCFYCLEGFDVLQCFDLLKYYTDLTIN